MWKKEWMILWVVCVIGALLMNMTVENTDLSGLLGSSSEEMKEEKGLPLDSYYAVIEDDDGNISLVKLTDKIVAEIIASEEEQEIEEPKQEEEGETEISPISEAEVISLVKIIDLPTNSEDGLKLFSHHENYEQIMTFSSFEELKSYIENNTYYHTYDYCYRSESNLSSGPVVYEFTLSSTGASQQATPGDTTTYSWEVSSDDSDHSTTNIQVAGVDEGDIVKNDGKYAYIVSKDKHSVIIADVYPAEEARILTQINTNSTITEIYVTENELVLLGRDNYGDVCVYILNISDRENPELINSYSCEGSIIQSRRVGDYLYLIVNQYLSYQLTESELPISPSQIHYFPDYNGTNQYSYSLPLTTIMSIDVSDPSAEPNSKSILVGYSNNIYVSTGNIYITYTQYSSGSYYSSGNEKTVVHRISINDGEIRYRAMGEVPGRVLNRFSMSEYQGFFRIATTSGHVSRSGESSSNNQVYVLDMDLNTVGSVEEIAPGEKIYSARFMGNRGYLVTFKKVDPFFVIDLSNPYYPIILGELKIPGYSNYLHPYDENHVIGIGKDTVEADGGNFAWYQGVKLSLFDVTDVENPKELSKYIIGDRGTNSLALSDPHAFLFSMEKNLLVIPIDLAIIDESKYPQGASANTHGEHVWDGAYVFDISLENGFVLKDRISHSSDEESQGSYWYYYSSDSIKRSFYIEDVLYTCSDEMIKMNDLDTLDDLNELVLTD